MVIKDILKKVSKPGDPENPQVKALREKLAKLSAKPEAQPGVAKPQGASPTAEKTKPAQSLSGEAELEALAKASDAEQRHFAQNRDPKLKLQEERTHKLVAKQINELIELATELNKRLVMLEKEKNENQRELERLEEENKTVIEKMDVIDRRLEKFMGLYEVITNQYNPFANEETRKSGMKLQLNDNLKGTHEQVSIEQGEMSSENQKKIHQLLAELEEQEREKQHDSPNATEEATVRQKRTQEEIELELGNMFEGFEERMKKYLDKSLQEQLHITIESLESALNKEIKQAVKEEVVQLKRTPSMVDSALEELEELEKKATDHEAFKKMESTLTEEVHHMDDEIKAIPPSLYFRLHDGTILKSKNDLIKAIDTMSDQVFRYHVNEEHNDFADWLELALKDKAGQLIRGRSKGDMRNILNASM